MDVSLLIFCAIANTEGASAVAAEVRSIDEVLCSIDENNGTKRIGDVLRSISSEMRSNFGVDASIEESRTTTSEPVLALDARANDGPISSGGGAEIKRSD
jgi:hypothetical protein